MGYLLKEALKTLCGVNQWCYAIFWKIGCQNPKLLIWEECYYEPVIYSNGVQASNKVHLLVTKMMKDNYINLVGEGLVGRVAFTRNHQWITSDNNMLGVHPPEVSNEVYTQFSAGIQTIAVIPIHPHGVVQLGSSSTIMENIGFVSDVKSLITQLGCVPGALLSENYMKNEDVIDITPNIQEINCHLNSVTVHPSGKAKVTECSLLIPDSHSPQASGGSGHTSYSFSRRVGDNSVICQSSAKFDPKNDQKTVFGSFSANYDPLKFMEQHILSDAFLGDHVNAHVDEQLTNVRLTSDKSKLEHELFQALTMSSEETCLKPQSRDDLFDIVGMDFKNNLFDGNMNNKVVNNRVEPNALNYKNNNNQVLDPFSVYEGESDSGIYSSTASDHLLEAVVSKAHSSSKQIADDNMSYSSLTNYSSSIWANRGVNLMQKELTGAPKLKKTGSYLYKSGISKEDMGNFSDTSSIISSQISSWGDQRSEVKKENGFGIKKMDENSKSNRKRLKPGENPRPRPKDRQMIQDRVKELREIVPNGAKCSIDALLERTIKHMLFLQSVTKHADKLKQTGESKVCIFLSYD